MSTFSYRTARTSCTFSFPKDRRITRFIRTQAAPTVLPLYALFVISMPTAELGNRQGVILGNPSLSTHTRLNFCLYGKQGRGFLGKSGHFEQKKRQQVETGAQGD